jgi:glycosyltransferase involved in cell wall biosynthesis
VKVLNIGISEGSICGVHDYANGMAEELRMLGNIVETRWCVTGHSAHRVLSWINGFQIAPQAKDVDVIVWHYSVFSYGTKGIPFLVFPLIARLRLLKVPVVIVLHEYAYPWDQSGWRGKVWAVTQRLTLLPVVWSAVGLVVTVQERADWLGQKALLPRRPVVAVPVFSNLPERDEQARDVKRGKHIGMFGYPTSGARLTMQALAELKMEEPSAELWLIGAPGPDSETGAHWRDAAAKARVENALRFTGPLCLDGLVRAISDCDVAVFNDGSGPSSRKTTLAAFLAAGIPVVAVDGSDTWHALDREGAVQLVQASSRAIATALAELVRNTQMRQELGRLGQQFYHKHQARRKVAGKIDEFMKSLL